MELKLYLLRDIKIGKITNIKLRINLKIERWYETTSRRTKRIKRIYKNEQEQEQK